MVTVLLARNAWIPKSSAPLALSVRKASKSCSVVMPYLESPGLSMMPLESWNRPPGLKRQLTVLGMGPATCSKNSMWLMSSKLTMAPSLSASSKSAAGVSLDENMMSCPVMPSERAIMSSV